MAKKQKKEQDIGFDFSEIKGKLFSKSPKGKSGFNKYSTIIIIVAFILISMVFSIHYRAYSANLPMAEDLAENSVKNMLKNNVASQVKSKYPNLPNEEVQKIINQQVSAILEQGTINSGGQQVAIDQIIEQQANYYREQLQHEDGHTYLLAIDPYYFYRHTQNYLEQGNEWGAEKNGGYYDPLVLAGMPQENRNPNENALKNLHVLVSAWTYRIMSFFNGNITLMGAMFWVPVIIASISVIPAFFIGRKISGDFGGLLSAMFIALHPAFISRTAGGFSDTDAYNILFPLFAAWFFLEALDAKDIKNASIWGAATGLAMGLFAFAWQGWYFMLMFIFITAIVYLAYKIIAKRKGLFDFQKSIKDKSVKQAAIVTGVFVVATSFFVSLFTSFKEFMRVFSIFDFTQIKVVGISKIWPNVYTTVAELNPQNLAKTLNQVSMSSNFLLLAAFIGVSLPLAFYHGRKKATSWGSWVYLSAIIFWSLLLVSISRAMTEGQIAFAVLLGLPAAVYGVYRAYKKEDVPIHYTVLLLVWFAGTVYATGKGMRFVILIVPVFSIAAGIAIGRLIEPLKTLGKLIEVKPLYLRTAAAVIIFLLLFAPIIPGNIASKAEAQAKNEIPSMNDDWYNTLTKIKKESEPDAIINSWWDFGHWFAAIGQRPVTLDGGRQNSPQAHWLGKLMLTSDENESVGILRYLDCGANTGYDELLELNNNSPLPRYTTIQQIYSILPKNSEGANKILVNEGFSQQEADDVMQFTHCKPPENYFITSQDMVGKSGVWAHFGSWDFERASMFNLVHNNDKDDAVSILQEQFGFDENNAENKYNEIMSANADKWIAPWPGYMGSANCNENNGTISCNNGIEFNLKTEEFGQSLQQGKFPENIAYIKDGEFKVKTYEENLLELNDNNPFHKSHLGIAFVPRNGGYQAVLMDSRLTGSMFTRLFYFENQDGGLKHFEKFHQTTDINGQKIIVWKVNWEGSGSAGNESQSVFEI